MKFIEEIEDIFDGPLDNILRKNADEAELRLVPAKEFIDSFDKAEKGEEDNAKDVFTKSCVIYFEAERRDGTYHLVNMQRSRNGNNSTSPIQEVRLISDKRYEAILMLK